MESPWDGETRVCSNGPGHMTKMATMPIYGKNLKKSSSPEPKSRWPRNLVCNIGCTCTIKFVHIMTLGLPWPVLRQGQIWSFMLVWEKDKTMDFFSETIVVYDLKLATNDRSDKKFLLTSKLRPRLPRCYIHVLNHDKNVLKKGLANVNVYFYSWTISREITNIREHFKFFW